MKKLLLIAVFIAQTVCWTVETSADINNPVAIINGKSMPYTSNSNDNWYTFSLAQNGYVLFLGNDVNGSFVGQIKIYKEDLEHAGFVYTTESIYLSAGKYLINVRDKYAGTLTVYSSKMSNPVDSNPPDGSILAPYLPQNGVAIAFSTSVQNNVFSFGMRASGNLQINGLDANGNNIGKIKIYNNYLEYIAHAYSPESISLVAGKYYLVIEDNYPGYISLYAPVYSAIPDPPQLFFYPAMIMPMLQQLLLD